MGGTGKVEGPFEPSRPEEVQKEKRTEEGLKGERPQLKEAFFISFVSRVFKGVVNFFEKRETPSFLKEKKALVQFKVLLDRLKLEDCSEDPQFFRELASSWGAVLEAASFVSKDSVGSALLDTLIRDFGAYALDKESRSVGYYLAEYSGEKWLPFPYIELVRSLYQEHQKDMMKSKLTHWGQLVDRIVAQFVE